MLNYKESQSNLCLSALVDYFQNPWIWNTSLHVSVISKNISAIYVNDLFYDQEWRSDINFSKCWNCIEDVSTNDSDKLYWWMFFL